MHSPPTPGSTDVGKPYLVAEDFFETATSVKDANFRSPTYYVKMDSDCGTKKRTIHYQENGFERLIFSSEEGM